VPQAASFGYPMTAVYGDTPPEPRGPWVTPGAYVVRLIVDGRAREQPLSVRLDPRVKASQEELEAQHKLSMRLCAALDRVAAARTAAPVKQGRQPEPGDRLAVLHRQLTRLLDAVEEVDGLPTPAVSGAAEQTMATVDGALAGAKGGER